MKWTRARIIVASAASAFVLLAAGTAAGASIAASPIDGSGVIHGCYVNTPVNGVLAIHLVSAGAPCPDGMIAISWNQKGPAGATGPAGPAGPAGPKGDTGATGPAGPAGLAGPTGATGAAGPAGAAGSAGKDGNTVLSGTGPPASTVGSDGDFYIDTAASVLYGPKANGTWPAAGTSLVGPAGAEGPAGPQGPSGPQGPPGSGGVSSVTDFNGITCTTDGGAVGTVTASTAGDNTVTLTCGAPPTDPNCTHSTGVQGLTYGDCNDLLGDPTTGTGYNQVMADLAARALQRITNGPLLPDGVDSCGDKVSVALFANGTVVEWTYQATRNVLALTQAGEVHTETFNAYQAGQGANPPNTGECPNASDPKWN